MNATLLYIELRRFPYDRLGDASFVDESLRKAPLTHILLEVLQRQPLITIRYILRASVAKVRSVECDKGVDDGCLRGSRPSRHLG